MLFVPDCITCKMEKELYVNYLNRPKRAKFNADSEIVLQQILQAYVWNNCLTFREDTPKKPVRRTILSCGEKSNLKAEVKFDASKSATEVADCNCIYRKRPHNNFAENSNDSESVRKIKEAKKTDQFNSNRIKYKPVLNSQHHRLSFKALHASYTDAIRSKAHRKSHYANRFLPYLNKKYSHLSTGASFRQNSSLHSSFFKSKYQPLKLAKSCSSQSKSQPMCVLDCDDLCSCINIPVPASDLSISPHDYQSYAIRKTLSVCITSLMKSAKVNSHLQVSMPVSLKRKIELWCGSLSATSQSSTKCHHLVKDGAVKQVQYNYSFYDKKDSEKLFHQIKADISLSLNLLCDMCLLSFIEKHFLHKVTGDENSTNGKVKNKLFSDVSNQPICCCAGNTIPTNGACFQLNGTLSQADVIPEKRISSRLKEKRDSGLQRPFSDDYVVEVPVVKKVKRPKLAHSYSHYLFWNFYESHKSSEKHKWTSLARSYYNLSAISEHCSLLDKSAQTVDSKNEVLGQNGLLKRTCNNGQRSGKLSTLPNGVWRRIRYSTQLCKVYN